MRKRSTYRRKGFTLVELIVVIVIIAVIAAVAIPRMVSMQKGAYRARVQAEHRQIVTAIQVYKAKQDDPTTAVPGTFVELAPFISLNGLSDPQQVMKVLASRNGVPAHRLTATQLISTYEEADGSQATMIYDMR